MLHIFVRRKIYICGTYDIFKSAKRLGSANGKPPSYKSTNYKKIWPQLRKAHKFADLRFAELIGGPPTFVICTVVVAGKGHAVPPGLAGPCSAANYTVNSCSCEYAAFVR